MQQNISHTEENYLKALFSLENSKGEATVNEISKKLNIKMPTVNSMVKRLAEKNLVTYESYQPLKLTKEGKKIAALIVRKHRLTEMFLVEIMNFGWDNVHEVAEQIEHIKSPEFFNKMDEMLGYPTEDPHGAPIPNVEGVMPKQNYIKLSECKLGEQVVFRKVSSDSKDLLSYLDQKNLELGMEMEITHIEKFDGTLSVLCNQKEIMLSAKVANNLFVEPKKK